MGYYIIFAAIIIVCLIFPMAINSQFSKKYYQGALEPVPIILNSMGLFSIVLADAYGKMLGWSVIFTIVLYAISIFLVKRSAEELGCTTAEKVKMILANALLPVSIIFFILLLLTSASNKKKKVNR